MIKNAAYMRALYEETFKEKEALIKEREEELFHEILSRIENRSKRGYTHLVIPTHLEELSNTVLGKLQTLGFREEFISGVKFLKW